MNKHLSSITCCCLLVVGAEVLAEVTATPSGATTDVNGVLTPQTSDAVLVGSRGGDNVVSIDNDAAENVTVNVSGAAVLKPATSKSAINLGSGAAINNDGTITTISSVTNSVQLGANALVTNSGDILFEGGGNHSAVSVSSNSNVINTGLIEASEVSLSTVPVGAFYLGNLSTLVNNGTIRIIGNTNDLAGRGSAVTTNGSDVSISNAGTIDASKGGWAITHGKGGQVLIDNAGTIIGGSGGAMRLTNAEGSVITLKTGSQITGDVLVRVVDRLRKTDAELSSPLAINLCNRDPSRSICFKTVSVLPQNASLKLEGTGTEDDRLTGFNQIVKYDAGAWTLGADFQAGSASDSYQTGDFRGTLSINVDDATGQLILTGNVTDNGDGTTGSLVKNGNGTLTLSGTSTYSGSTAINAGTLETNGGNAIGNDSAVTVASGATLSLTSGETIGSLAGAGSVDLNGQSLRAGGNNSSTTYSGSINGSGSLEKFGTGTLTLSGTSNSTGSLLVQEGALDARGAFSMLTTVGTLATLKGSGTLGGLTNLGRVAPGNSVGVLNVSGNYFQDTSGTLEIEITPDGSAADQLLVGGNVVLAGTLSVNGENGGLLTPAVGGQTYTIITAGSGVTDQFDSAPSLGAFTFQPIYNANDVQMGVTYTGFTPIQQSATGIPGAGTKNQVTKAIALDKVLVIPTGFNSGNADFDQVLLEIASETADELANTYNNIIAEPYAAYMTVLLEQNDFFAETVLDRAQGCSVSSRNSLGSGFTQQPDTADVNALIGCGSSAGVRQHGAWVDASWVKGNVRGGDGLSGYDYRMTGIVAGVDNAFGSNLVGGVAFGYSESKLDNYELADAKIQGNNYFLSTYGTYARQDWEFSGLLGFTFGDYDSSRRIRFGSIDRTANGEFDGKGMIASAKAAYFYEVNDVSLVPEFGLTYSKIWQDGFTETGAGSLNLKVEDANAYSLVTSVGLRLSTIVQKGETRYRPHALLRYDYDWNAGNDEDHDLKATFAEVPVIGPIDVVGQNRGKNGVIVGGGLAAQITDNVDLFVNGSYRWHNNGDDYTFSAGVRMTW